MRVLPTTSWMRYSILIFACIWLSSCVYLAFTHLNLLHKEACSQCSTYEKTVDDLIIRVDQGANRLRESLDALVALNNIGPVKQETRSKTAPFASHELLRRRALHYTQEIWNTISGQLGPLVHQLKGLPSAAAKLQQVEKQVGEITRLLEVDVHGLGRVDGAAQWQAEGLGHLGQLLTNRLESLQNPRSSCSTARFLLVDLDRPCAFGCNVHHLIYCFIFAYASGRTLLLGQSGEYTDWWLKNFQPLSSRCSQGDVSVPTAIPFFTESTLQSKVQFLRCPYIGDLDGAHRLLPPAVPTDLATPLASLHGAPFVWFAGQLLGYLMRPTAGLSRRLSAELNATALAVPTSRRAPVVGVHIRRSDKINTEAQFHNLTEYMVHVERFFDMVDDEWRMMSRTHEWQGDRKAPPGQLQKGLMEPVPRQVYLATDDPSVLKEATVRYPNYRFIGDADRAKLAGSLRSRTVADAIFGITLDIVMLSKTDYLVCTFSSQVCRVAYELMQTRDQELGDASWRFRSLDDGYYFGGQQKNLFETLVPDADHGLAYGQLVKIAGNHWDGFAMLDRKTVQFLAPAYKFRPKLLSVPMGNY